jgi:hypothetical protein
MLQAVAQAQIKLAGFKDDEIEKMMNDGFIDGDVWNEITEMHKPKPWPHVEEDDWCGEWQARLWLEST